MKHIHLYLPVLLAVLLLLPACKQDTWVDWKIENEAWLLNNATKEGVKTTPSGLQYKVIREGIPTNPRPDNLKSVVVTYQGSLITRNVFDKRTNSAMAVSSLIMGFSEGLKLMTAPAHYIFYIPADLGYGDEGMGTEGEKGYIPPHSTLIFDVELQNVY